MTANDIYILVQVFIGAVGTFCAILLWSKTRNVAWIFIIIGTIVLYTRIVFFTLEEFGIIEAGALQLFGVPVFQLFLDNIPIICFIVGFSIKISKNKM